jgi:Tfp pilus assembly protein PilF
MASIPWKPGMHGQIRKRNLSGPRGALHLAASYAQAGRTEDARAALARHLELEPQMTLEHAVTSMPFNAEGQERYREALRKAGMPEKPPAPGT